MAEFKLVSRPALGGAHACHAGCEARETRDLNIASLAANRADQSLAALNAACTKAFGTELPGPGQRIQAGHLSFAWAGHQQWFVTAPSAKVADLSEALLQPLATHAVVTDQSGGWVEIKLTGPQTRTVLERLCPIDLHPSAFALGATARTVIEHLGVQIALLDDAPTFALLTPSSSAHTFWSALEHALASACGPSI